MSSASQQVAFGHVHGLAVNPADDRLYVASHLGVFRQTEGAFDRIADRWQDTMASTVTGHDTFLASGHPDMRETDKPIHLGLIESTNAARSWNVLSLEGEADFHALEPAGDRLYGCDSNNGVLKVTRDRHRWADIARLTVIDLAVNPTNADNLLIADKASQLRRLTPDMRIRAVRTAPPMALIDWPEYDLLVGVATDGSVHRSRDAGRSWQPLTRVGRRPQPWTSPRTCGTSPSRTACTHPPMKGAPGQLSRTSPVLAERTSGARCWRGRNMAGAIPVRP